MDLDTKPTINCGHTKAYSFDLERLIPDLLSDDTIELDMIEMHRARYAFAGRFVQNERVLDCACGVGYGSEMLAQAGAAFVLGVDISAEAIEYGREHYKHPAIEFLVADGRTMQPKPPFDVVISLETIEHVVDPAAFIKHLVAQVKPGGIFIGSVPTTLSTDVNPYHIHDIGEAEFRAMFHSCGLTVIDELSQKQRFSPFHLQLLGKTSRRRYQFRKSLPTYYATHPIMLFRRLWMTLTVGFVNKYLVLAGKKEELPLCV